MIAQSIVPQSKVKNDPRQLVYHFPSIPNIKLSKILNTYFFNRSIQIAEQVANITGHHFIPADCMHWKRKRNMADRRVYVSGNSFYVMEYHEMTNMEREKYEDMIADARGDVVI